MPGKNWVHSPETNEALLKTAANAITLPGPAPS